MAKSGLVSRNWPDVLPEDDGSDAGDEPGDPEEPVPPPDEAVPLLQAPASRRAKATAAI